MATLNAINPYLKYGARLLYNVGVAGRRRVRDGCLHAVRHVDRLARVLRNQNLVIVLGSRNENAIVTLLRIAHVNELSIVRTRHRTNDHKREICECIKLLLNIRHPRVCTNIHARRLVVFLIIICRLIVFSCSRIPARCHISIVSCVSVRCIKHRCLATNLRRVRKHRRAANWHNINSRAVRTDYANRDPCGNVRHGRRAFAELLASLCNRHEPAGYSGKTDRFRRGGKRTKRRVPRFQNRLMRSRVIRPAFPGPIRQINARRFSREEKRAIAAHFA